MSWCRQRFTLINNIYKINEKKELLIVEDFQHLFITFFAFLSLTLITIILELKFDSVDCLDNIAVVHIS